ncbi:hypothetical protein BSQ39_05205 [Loigolactobacillus backii]|uniref:YaaL family protein n=1 Tax=Loigolactobacillus backii TaxID=375175 RepID=UPI000C1C9A0D|nr:YaaL family protein [Loigolactobacillus backii]PIO83011.1 hypothetical protein BSQ39_05205 [Loigolactobacillus backii]
MASSFLGRHKGRSSKLIKEYDEKLLTQIAMAMTDWNKVKDNSDRVINAAIDDELYYQRQLARAKYLYLYHEARLRGTKSKQLMPGTEKKFLE